MENLKRYRVLCFRDSLTKGYYAKGHKYYPYSKVLGERFPNLKFIGQGKNGEFVVNMKQRLEKILKSGQFDYAILLGGVNDLGCNISVDEIVEAFKDIYSCIESQNNIKKFYHVTIPYNVYDKFKKEKSTKDKINNTILEELHSDKRIVINIGDHFNYIYLDDYHRELYWDDGLHYTVKGYDMLAKCIGDALQFEHLIF